MRNSYWVLGLAVLVSLSRVGLGQVAPTREDSVKGKIWTATARRVWADENLTLPATRWATGTDFMKWVLIQKPDKTELGSLWSAVLGRVGKGKPATPAQVAQAVLAEISQRKEHKTGALAKINLPALQAELTSLGLAAGPAVVVAAVADSAATSATNQPAGPANLLAEDPNPAPETRTLPITSTYTVRPVAVRYLGMPPAVAGIALALLGALAGASIASQRRSKRRYRPHSYATAPAASAAEPENPSVMTSPEYRKLHKQNENLTRQLQQLKQQLADLQKQLLAAPATAATPKAVAPSNRTPPARNPAPAAPAPIAQEISVEEMVGAVPPLPPATRYGPVQETPFVEERKIVDSPLPQLALMLTVNPQNPGQATFTLNPQVDKARLIGDGLTRLQKFFDYDLPAAGRITSVAAGAKGTLQRHADGWQVVERARLLIS